MASPNLLFVVLALSMINLSESTLEVHLDANNHLPTHIGEDIALSLKCSFFSNDTHDDFQSIYEISICEVDQDKETKLATFNALVHDILLFIDNASTKVEGKAYTTNGYLKIDTTADEATGQNFSCVVKYVDKTFGFNTLTARASIKGNNIFTLLTEKFTAHEERFSKLERNLTGLEGRLSALEVQMSKMNNKLSTIDNTLAKLDSSISRVLNITEENRKKIHSSEANFNYYVRSLGNLTVENQSNITRSISNLQSSVEDNQRKLQQKLNLTRFVKSCHELTVDVLPRQTIKTGDGTPYLCDTVTDNGGWTVFQRRLDGKQDFNQNWTMYEQGFGDVHTDFWLGLRKIRNLVKEKPHELRVDFVYHGKSYFALYDSFKILDASTNYKLLVSGYDGNAGDGLSSHNHMAFSTLDRDNDPNSRNSVHNWPGAWWYKSCHESNLNGLWGAHGGKGLIWTPTTESHSATFTEMKIRPTT